MRVRMLRPVAGPEFGPFDPGAILDVPPELAREWIRDHAAEAVDFVPVVPVVVASSDDLPEFAVSPVVPEVAVKRGRGRPPRPA